jgi:hypothetical protein
MKRSLSHRNALIEHLKTSSTILRPQKTRPQHWLNLSIGRSRSKLCVTANTRDNRLGVELYFSGNESKKNFANLMNHKDKIEQDLGFELDWQELPDAKACRVATYCPEIVLEDESRWPEYLDWVTKGLVMMDKTMRPILRLLP